ncbi:MAG TPA: RuBisCO large subunit C-terminal-like domain-containing protein [Nitrospiraceae bacterium]|jgi:ribulose-bisphosphate carboxylase large chain|nr:RuBisCO large subunit C-terminal-like domain-containing protein [Nitrospiraceae bacterium]
MTAHLPTIFSGTRFQVTYHVRGAESEARAKAKLICIDQTVEAPEEILPAGTIRDEILGRIEAFRSLGTDRHEAVISFPIELLTHDCSQLLNVVFGISSLKRGVRVAEIALPEHVLRQWSGPRFGRIGLRVLVDVPDRPLVCGVLKPLGLSPTALADLAYRFALGGLDLVKDDQSLGDQPFCPFRERVQRCAEAVARANRETGRKCLYVPHVSGPWETMHERCLIAEKAGAGGLLICPGLTGYDGLRLIAQDDGIGLPILSHPALLGTYYVDPESGIAPWVLFGQLPRLAGADVSIYPTFGLEFPIAREDCGRIAAATAVPWGPLKPIFPTAAGRMGFDRIKDMCELYGNDVLFILGSRIQWDADGLVNACRRFLHAVGG